MSKRFIDVAAGLILTPDGQLLLAQRPSDKHWSGWWELPGGKLEPGETPTQALVRELKEELDIDVTHATPWVTYTHEYPQTIVRLAFHRVTGWNGKPSGVEGQALAWTDAYGTPSVSPVLPATEPPLRWLKLPDRYLITSISTPDQLEPFLKKLTAALEAGVRLVQFREPAWALRADQQGQGQEFEHGHEQAQEHEQLYDAFQRVLALCRQHGAYCLVNSVHPEEWGKQADGIHYRAVDAAMLKGSRADEAAASAADDTTEPTKVARGEATDSVAEGTGNGRAGNALHEGSEAAKDTDLAEVASVSEADSSPPATRLPGAVRGDHYIAMSAHTLEDLEIARQINADFVVLGHVLDSPSHPDVPGIGWERFSELNRQAGLPVFAIGGQSSETSKEATAAGAHGIAGIRFSSDF